MRFVYCYSKYVLAYTGEQVEYTKDAMAYIKIQAYKRNAHRQASSVDSETQLRRKEAFLKSINRPWFRRAWSVSEIMSGFSVLLYSGKSVIDWHELSSAIMNSDIPDLISSYSIDVQKILEPQILTVKRLSYTELFPEYAIPQLDGLFLIRMLNWRRCLEFIDPRDKVFSVLSFVGKSYRIDPDYRRTPEEVYQEVAEKVVSANSKHLAEILSCCDPSYPRSVPSWCPDWKVMDRPDGFVELPRKSYDAGKGTTASVMFQDNEMLIRGVCIDAIGECEDFPIPEFSQPFP